MRLVVVLTMTMMMMVMATASLVPGPSVYAYCGRDPSLGRWNASQIAALSPPMPGHRLERVTLLTRHGDRTPMVPFRPSYYEWSCGASEHLGQGTESRVSSIASPHRLLRHVYLAGRQALAGNCTTSMLTERGVAQMTLLGEALRVSYVDGHGLANTTRDVQVRSSDVSRTLMSAYALLHGMFPDATASGGVTDLVDVSVVANGHDNLSPGPQCPGWGAHVSQVQHSDAFAAYMNQPDVVETVAVLTGLLGAQNTSLSLESPAYAYNLLMDNWECKTCHGMGVMPGVNASVLSALVKIATWRWGVTFNGTLGAKLAMGTLFWELAEAVHNGTSPLYYISAHDSTLTGILAGLRLWDGMWPPFASHLAFEVWSDTANGGQEVIRVQYNGQTLVTETADAFAARIAEVAVPFSTYPDLCRVPPSPPPPQHSPSPSVSAGATAGIAIATAAVGAAAGAAGAVWWREKRPRRRHREGDGDGDGEDKAATPLSSTPLLP